MESVQAEDGSATPESYTSLPPVQSVRSALVDAVLGIGLSLDIQSTLEAIVKAVTQLTGADSSSLWLLEPDGRYQARAAFGMSLDTLQPIRLSPSAGLLGRMRKTLEPVQVHDFERDVPADSVVLDQVRRTGTHATLAVPLVHENEVIGALYATRHAQAPFPDATVDDVRRLARFAQVALNNAQRFREMDAERSRLQAYLDAIPEGVIVVSREGEILTVNRSLELELGGRPRQATPLSEEGGTRVYQLGSRRVRFSYDPGPMFGRVVETGLSEQGLLEMEDPYAVFEVTANPIRGASGEIEGVIGTLRDISAPLALQRERTRSLLLSRLLELSAGLNTNLTESRVVDRVVEAALDLLGAQAGLMGVVRGDQLVFPRVFRDGEWQEVDFRARQGSGLGGHVWQTGEPLIRNGREQDAHGQPEVKSLFGFQRSVLVPVFNRAGTIIAVLQISEPLEDREFTGEDVDVLQLLAHQAAIALENAQLNDLKDEFLSMVSHELRTPITAIKGFIQVLQRRLSPESLEKTQRYLTVLNAQTDRLNGLIGDLLDLSRVQRGAFQFDLETLDYARLVRDAIAEMELVAGDHTIVLSAPESLQVIGNGQRLQQVLVNLCDNAFKYGPRNGEVHITVEAYGDEVATYVCDEGPGLPREEADRIFSPYYQIRRGEARSSRGLGLGLYISRKIVEQHGGRIWLDSEDHTSFCFTVPRA